jgi:gliding motility-associated protein GldE
LDPDPLLSLIEMPTILLVSIINTSVAPLVVLLFILLCCSALISAAEVAFFSLSPQDVDGLSKEEDSSSRKIVRLRSTPRRLLATVLVSNNFINIAIVIISEILLRKIISDETFNDWAFFIQESLSVSFLSIGSLSKILSFTITVVGVTFLLVLFGEVAPKIYANSHNVKHARLMAAPLIFLGKLFSPLIRLVLLWTGGIEERIYRSRLKSRSGADKKDLDKAIELAVSPQAGQEEVDMLKGIINFGDVETRQIMKSRVDVFGIEVNQNFDDVITLIKDSGFSRLPVYEESFDTIMGILYVKDLLGWTQEGVDFVWQELIHKNVLYVPETKKIDELLKEFQSKRTHMAIVVDEYGGCSGIVTLEDIMEEIVGEIHDEFDSEEEIDFVQIDDKNFIFEGKTLLNDVVRILSLDSGFFDDGRGNADSLAGLVLELESMIPKRGKIISYKHLKLSVETVTTRRIERIKITVC